MSDELKWCEMCGDRSEGNCGQEACPMRNPIVDTGDELHQILGEALRKALSDSSQLRQPKGG
jgi:hypothetical protein